QVPRERGPYKGRGDDASRRSLHPRADGDGNRRRSAPIQMRAVSVHIMKTPFEDKATMSRTSPIRSLISSKTPAARRALAIGAPLVAGALMLSAAAPAPPTSPVQTAPANAAGSEVLPGYWEYTTSALGQRDTERKCVRPSEINRFFGGLSTR